MVMMIAAIIYFLKCRHDETSPSETNKHPRPVHSDEPRVSNTSSAAASEIIEQSERSEISPGVYESIKMPPAPPTIDNPPAKLKRSVLTKQQFDDFY